MKLHVLYYVTFTYYERFCKYAYFYIEYRIIDQLQNNNKRYLLTFKCISIVFKYDSCFFLNKIGNWIMLTYIVILTLHTNIYRKYSYKNYKNQKSVI